MRIETAAPPAPPRSAGRQAAGRGLPLIATFFVLSLLVPIIFYVGPLRFLPHRVFLLLTFLPLVWMLLSGRAGRLVATDYLVIGSAIWASLALFASAPGSHAIEPIGIHFVEFLGAYLVGRIAIRSAQDFRRFVRFFFCVAVVLLPLAALESMLHRSFLLEIIPNSHGAVPAGGPRWGLRRAQTVFAHPILYGAFVSTGIGLCWYALRPSAGFVTRVALVFPVGFATFFSLSSGAMVALVIQTGMIFWDLLFRRFPGHWRIFGWGVVASYLLLNSLSNRTPFHLLVDYATFSSGTAYMRIVQWRWGIDNVWANPVFGLGLNVSSWERASWMTGTSVDNFWLLIAMQYGVPTFLLLAFAIVMLVRRTTKAALADPVDRACRTGHLVSLAGLVVAAGTVHYWQAMMAFFLFMIGAGMWVCTGGAAEAGPEAAEKSRKRAARPADGSPWPGRPASPETEARPRARAGLQ